MHLLQRCAMAVLLASTIVPGGNAWAAADDKQRMLKSLQERAQKIQQENLALQDEKRMADAARQEAEKRVKQLRAELDSARRSLRADAAAQKEVDILKSEKDALEQRLFATDAQLGQSRSALKALQDELGRSRGESTSLKTVLDQRAGNLASCENLNAGLYKLNTELLDLYEKSAPKPGLLKGGLFTRIDQVSIENETERQRDKLDELKLMQSSKQQ